MAATHSSFMTTRFYSPIFNTALFDGPMRIYFSQSYESAALKIYHLLQSEYVEIWNLLKAHAPVAKEHLFLMIYPETKDLHMVFDKNDHVMQSQEWTEGLAIGITQTRNDQELKEQLEFVAHSVKNWVGSSVSFHEAPV